jgi:DNA-binding SARP family transcriptional activator/tetratricopeptide (TPR) repeat protein
MTSHDFTGAHQSVTEVAGTIDRYIRSGELDAAHAALVRIDPFQHADTLVVMLTTQLAKQTSLLVRQHPALGVLRAWMFDGNDHDEVAHQLLDAGNRLLALSELSWAAFAFTGWARWLRLQASWEQLLRIGAPLLATHPQLRAAAPAFVGFVATAASMEGERLLAERLWDDVMSMPEAHLDADVWWDINIEYARMELLHARGDYAPAVNKLRMAREHFGGRTDLDAVENFHTASANLAYALVRLGRAEEGLTVLERDLKAFDEASLHAQFLLAMLAWVEAHAGRFDDADRHLREMHDVPTSNPSLFHSVIGPARLMVARARNDLSAANDAIADLLKLESSSSRTPDALVDWRCEAARTCAAFQQLDRARAFIDEAISIIDAPGMGRPWPAVTTHMLAATIQSSDSEALEHASRAVHIACEYGLVDVFTTWYPREGNAVLCAHAAMTDGELHPAVRTGLQIAGAPARDALAAWPVLARSVPQHRLDAISHELGWIVELATPRLTIQLFGDMSVAHDGEPVPRNAWRGRRAARMLLARMLLARGHSLHRDELADDVLPNVVPEKVGSSFSPLVHTVRRVLEPQIGQREAGRYITQQGMSYRIQMSRGDSCDVWDFADAVAECMRTTGDDAVAAGRRALAISTRELLAGEGFEPWIVHAREDAARARRDIMLRIGAVLLGNGGSLPPDIADAVREHVDRFAWDEQVAMLGVRHALAAGDIAAARAAYERMAHAMEVELGVDPSVDFDSMLVTARP